MNLEEYLVQVELTNNTVVKNLDSEIGLLDAQLCNLYRIESNVSIRRDLENNSVSLEEPEFSITFQENLYQFECVGDFRGYEYDVNITLSNLNPDSANVSIFYTIVESTIIILC